MDKINLNLVLVLAVALVITIPIVYGAVEPSIIINMITGQTTKPLQIKDNLGTEVFSIDVNGTVFPTLLLNDMITVLHFNQTAEITQTITTTGFDDYQVLAEWRLDYPSDVCNSGNFCGANKIEAPLNQLTGFMKSSAGSCGISCQNFVKIGIARSFDGITYAGCCSPDIGNSDITYDGEQDTTDFETFCSGRPQDGSSCFLSLRWGTDTTANGTASAKLINFNSGIYLPEGVTLTQVCC